MSEKKIKIAKREMRAYLLDRNIPVISKNQNRWRHLKRLMRDGMSLDDAMEKVAQYK